MADLKYVIETIESTHFGDHGERLRRSHVTVDGEAVQELLVRVLDKVGERYRTPDPTDEIVIRLVDASTDPEARASDPWGIKATPPGPEEPF